MRKILGYLKYFFSGLAFGIANVIPGVSGGTMLVVFGVYDKLTEAISGIKSIIKNILFLLAFGLGAGAGILLFATVVTTLFKRFGLQTNMFFIALILGSIPLIYKLGTADNKVKPLCAVPFIIALTAVVGLAVLEKSDIINIAPEAVTGFDISVSLKILVCAVIAAVTMIIPGVSGSFIMMLLGVYPTIIAALRPDTFNLFVLIPFVLGALPGIVFGARLISTLITKHKLMTYSAIMGLIIGSVYAIIPSGFGFNLQTLFGFICLIIGIAVSILINKIGEGEK